MEIINGPYENYKGGEEEPDLVFPLINQQHPS